MNDFPNSWESITLQTLIDYALGGDWGKDLDFNDPEYIEVLCIRGSEFRNWELEKGKTASLRKIKKTSLQNRRLHEGDILLEISGGGPEQPVGRTVLIDKVVLSFRQEIPKICTNFVRLIRPNKNVDSKFINYYLSYFYKSNSILDYQSGSNNLRNLKFDDYVKIRIPLPPQNEQKRIVSKIEELFSEIDKGLENLLKTKELLKAYRESLLKNAFGGKLTEKWREENKDKIESADQLLMRIRHEREAHYQRRLKEWSSAVKVWEANNKQSKKPAKPKKTKELPLLTKEDLEKLTTLPEYWRWVKWEDILAYEDGAFKRGPFGSALKKNFFEKSGYKIYEQYCPINDDCSFERYYISEKKFKELESFAVRENDFLISCSGVTLGRITKIPTNFKEGIINQALLRVRINQKIYGLDFFKTFFRSRYFQDRIFENSTGTAIPNVKGVNELKIIPLPLCSPLEQQQIIREIELRLSVVDKIEINIEESFRKSKCLRQSILTKAFSGELVSQDTSDEPANILLERIKAEKEIPKPQKKKSKQPQKVAV